MLINESNWKQELASLKARRIVLKQEYDALVKLLHSGVRSHTLIERAEEIEDELEGIDKAIETIENVFVHKQCYI